MGRPRPSSRNGPALGRRLRQCPHRPLTRRFRPGGSCQPAARACALDADASCGQPSAMLIFKILAAEEWAALEADGATDGAPVDLADGFIHFSTAEQAAETAAKHFAGRDGLVLAAVEADALGDALRWEPSRGGALFPHLYRALRRDEVVWARPLPLGADGAHVFPPEARPA